MKKKKRAAAPAAAARQPSTRSVLEIANAGPEVSPRSKRVALDRTQSGAAKRGSVEVAIEVVGVYAFHSDDTKPYDKGVVQSASKGFLSILPPREEACRQLQLLTCRHRPKRSCLNQTTAQTVGVR